MTTSAAQPEHGPCGSCSSPSMRSPTSAAEPLTALKWAGVSCCNGWATSPSARRRRGRSGPRCSRAVLLNFSLSGGRQGPSGRLGAVLAGRGAHRATGGVGGCAASQLGRPSRMPRSSGPPVSRRASRPRSRERDARSTPPTSRCGPPRSRWPGCGTPRPWCREHRGEGHIAALMNAGSAGASRTSGTPYGSGTPGTPTRRPGTSPTRSGRPAWTHLRARVWSTRGG